MRQVRRILSTYTADVSGVCSALYELGGMVVIHDPSGCNSTYNTHDEPRWYDQDSLIFISGLSEIDAIMGNDDKFIEDVVSAAHTFHPNFICLVRSPIPLMTGVDFESLAMIIEDRCGIPTYFIPTNGMHSYLFGVGEALKLLCEHYVDTPGQKAERLQVNLLGVTPLDFSINKTVDHMKSILRDHEVEIGCTFAMGESLENLSKASKAHVNLVVSSAGLKAAKVLYERFSIPYVVGLPVKGLADHVITCIKKSAQDGICRMAYDTKLDPKEMETLREERYLIGEPVLMQSLAQGLWKEQGIVAKVLCPLDAEEELFAENCVYVPSEEAMEERIRDAYMVVADPMYAYICSEQTRFVRLPHEAFSGRIYRKEIPDLMEFSIHNF